MACACNIDGLWQNEASALEVLLLAHSSNCPIAACLLEAHTATAVIPPGSGFAVCLLHVRHRGSGLISGAIVALAFTPLQVVCAHHAAVKPCRPTPSTTPSFCSKQVKVPMGLVQGPSRTSHPTATFYNITQKCL